MRILGSFDTKLDEHELYDAIQSCGKGNAILTKKHRIFMIRPMIWMLFAFMAFGLLIWFAYSQFYNQQYKAIFWALTIAYSLVTCAWSVHSIKIIIYNIKTQIHNKKGYIDIIDEKEFQDGKYEVFLKHTFVSAGLQAVLMVVNSIVSFFVETDATSSNMLLNITGVIVNIGFMFLLYKVLDRIIDYEMDFNIFTTDQFIIYRQHGFFKTESMNIAASTIKIVRELKSGFLGSLFNYGKVSIHAEGGLGSSDSIELFYVPSPKELIKKLNGFIEKSKEGVNVPTMS